MLTTLLLTSTMLTTSTMLCLTIMSVCMYNVSNYYVNESFVHYFRKNKPQMLSSITKNSSNIIYNFICRWILYFSNETNTKRW